MTSPSSAGPNGPSPANGLIRGGPIVLVGLSGAGKTLVGRLLATRLAWTHVDLDAEVERLAGRSIGNLFDEGGEAAFRALEAEATRSTCVGERFVVSTGGGWMTRPELRETWPDGTRVWLRVDPACAAARLARERSIRPLLAGPDLEAALRRQLGERSSDYRLAEISVRTERLGPEEVVDAILDRIRAARRRTVPPQSQTE